jgi:hypothetical protein
MAQPVSAKPPRPKAPAPVTTIHEEAAAPPPAKEVTAPAANSAKDEKGPVSLYKMSVDRLLNLIDVLESAQSLPEGRALSVLGLNAPSASRDYRRFLESGGALVVEDGDWKATKILTELAVALRNLDLAALRDTLAAFPSYAAIKTVLKEHAVGVPVEPTTFGRAAATYQTLAELTELGAAVHGRGFFATPTQPGNEAFVPKAIGAYQRLKKDGGWAETGAWLEELIRGEGLHPLIARRLLQDASEQNLLKRITEGSTTDTKLDRHTLRTLQLVDGTPGIKIEHLYRGDFLIPGKGSSSIRVEEARA